MLIDLQQYRARKREEALRISVRRVAAAGGRPERYHELTGTWLRGAGAGICTAASIDLPSALELRTVYAEASLI
ncbi:MAG: hypothetical protein IT531_20315 [Burkholderiales bacterium]|nr:hypothetical protein [Burkholderiales bacterium]